MQNLLEIADYDHFVVSQVIANQLDTFAFGFFVVQSSARLQTGYRRSADC